MRLLLHDYSGHPFQVELSRWLAGHGHDVLHLYSASIATPKGGVAPRPDDPPSFTVEPVALPAPVAKYSALRRVLQERTYARLFSARLEAFRPECVISGNCSPQIQHRILALCRRRRVPFVFWVQDLYAHAAERHLRDRFPLLGGRLAPHLHRYECRAIARSDAVIVITEDFKPLLVDRGIPAERITVIENWAPLDEVVPLPRRNAWAREQGLFDRFVFLYSGTLGLKHNPELLASLAESFRDRPDVAVAVVSNGPGRDWLEQARRSRSLDNLLLYDWQPYERLPQVLASGDVLIAILEPFAGVMAVPSKVLTYLCTRRPILAAIPPENLAARILQRSKGGLVLSPDDTQQFVSAAQRLLAESELRAELASAGRAYAESHFDIQRIGPRFLRVIDEICR